MTQSPRPPRRPVRLSEGDPLAGLARWVADGMVDEAARARARQRWLLRQAEEEATVSGVLVDLAERRRPVIVTTLGGRRVRGPVRAVGVDFCVIREPRIGDVVLPAAAMAAIRLAPGDQAVTGSRVLSLEIMMAEALAELAADRPEVLVVVADDGIRGELCSAGRDVVAIGVAGTRREIVHVPIAAVDHLVVLAR
ncbi:MAG: hypothetical protein ACE5GB_07170 [Acidimicrobiales bacterium]